MVDLIRKNRLDTMIVTNKQHLYDIKKEIAKVENSYHRESLEMFAGRVWDALETLQEQVKRLEK